jgi:hypothetical protein
MKNLLRLYLLLLLPFTLFGADSALFVGAEYGQTIANVKQNDVTLENGYVPQFGGKIGLREKNARVYLAYSAAQEYSDADYSLTYQNAYLALEGVSDEFRVIANAYARVFVGAHAGAFIPDLEIGGEDVGKTSLMGGAQGGLIFILPVGLELEFAYRHFWTEQDENIYLNAGTVYTALNFNFYTY